ncbi:MAG: alkaline phosphatase [Bacteroidales bacterium]|nr:alkaline phosphatase [Bacteroidales bacterium]MCF8332546.1 alkaline phosphatase [Bacteroidales bacterium]
MYLKTNYSWILAGAIFLLSISVKAQNVDHKRENYSGNHAKYVFLFIGDGMGFAHVAATEAYSSAISNGKAFKPLNFSKFPAQGLMTTNAANRFITGSAASGTALATGHKTSINTISMKEDRSGKYPTIAEKAKAKNMKVGIITSVSIDHATPAAFYAHEPVRHNYYNIGKQLTNSGFDYFGGGGFKFRNGRKGDQPDLIKMSKKNGYTLVDSRRDFHRLDKEAGKVIAMNPRLDDGAMPYAMDMNRKDISLADFTQKGIELLNNEDGFFMMVEGGKIDWSAHGNDAAGVIHGVRAFADAVEQAIAFYEEHPEETLIIVTADHETGGMAVGAKETKYSSYYERLKQQRVSLDVFGDKLNDLVRNGRNEEVSFDRVMQVTKKYIGLGKERHGLGLNKRDMRLLQHAYEIQFKDKENPEEMDAMALAYIGEQSFAQTAIEILTKKAGFSFTSNSHTGIPVPVSAIGPGAELFDGRIDNTDIPKNIETLLQPVSN